MRMDEGGAGEVAAAHSAAEGRRNSLPSHLRIDVNTTERAGMFTPSANVSVAKRT